MAAAKLDKLEALLARAALPDKDVAFLADLMSLPASERHPLPNLSSQRRKERSLEALIRQLESLAHRRPVLMVFEDAHWVDPTSRELLDLIVERVRRLPVLLIVTFRPEFQPPWIGEQRVTMLALNRLDRRDRAALAAQIAGKTLPESVIDQITHRTDGVPLFVEELTKTVLERKNLPLIGARQVIDPPAGRRWRRRLHNFKRAWTNWRCYRRTRNASDKSSNFAVPWVPCCAPSKVWLRRKRARPTPGHESCGSSWVSPWSSYRSHLGSRAITPTVANSI